MFRLLPITAFLVTILPLLGGISPSDMLQAEHEQTSTGTAFYVSKAGSNQDGRSWDTAWNELDQIDWTRIQPGDVIYLDGGFIQMQYETGIVIQQSGEVGNPIKIQASVEPDHAGRVVIWGGRDTPLPYCGQTEYDAPDQDALLPYGIRTSGYHNIEIDGMDWSGIVIQGFSQNGIKIDHTSENITVRNVEIHNNGSATLTDNGWQTDSPGVRLAGTNVVFQRVIVHDNGQDSFQGSHEPNNLHNFTLEESWLYNGRQHPTLPGEPFNNCTHPDGIQIFGGGVIIGITVRYSIIGPGFMQNLILGQTVTDTGVWAAVQDVILEDVLLVKANGNNVLGYTNTNSQNWQLNRLTVHCPNTPGQCLQIYNANHSVTNSIFVGGRINLPDGLYNYGGNCLWNMISSSVPLGIIANPEFVAVSDSDPFSLDDYSLRPDSPCRHAGSRLTSVSQLLGGATP